MSTPPHRHHGADGFPEADHDHRQCTATLVQRVEHACRERNVKLTDLRRRVLEELASSHQAIGAYDVIERLAAKGTRLAPISVYRALEALSDVGAIHRIESQNAFFACHVDHAGEEPRAILVCDGCLSVAEIDSPATFEALGAAVRAAGFEATRRMIEVSGRCKACRAVEPHRA